MRAATQAAQMWADNSAQGGQPRERAGPGSRYWALPSVCLAQCLTAAACMLPQATTLIHRAFLLLATKQRPPTNRSNVPVVVSRAAHTPAPKCS